MIAYHDEKWSELESQIYDITFDGEDLISSCRIVFLIPSFADGSESYYVYYDDDPKPMTSYPDHVSISESYYRYEPISGYPLESYYYKITDDQTIPYTVSQEGQLMGYNTGQHVVKMLHNITEVHPKYGDLFAAFDYKYAYANGLFDYSSTSQKLLSKEVFVDGNLMVSFGMVSTSKRDDLKTTVTYKYYHCPSDDTRMRAHVRHETLADVTTIQKASTDGVYASLQSGGVKSNSIQDLNIGEILPHLHFKDEFNEVNSYEMDIDPEYIPGDPDIRVVAYSDDVDLGIQPWICFNEGDQGLAHGLLFHNDQVKVSGTDEEDGLQINVFQMDYPHLPGLENNIATVQIGRNSYEAGSSHDISIPDDLIVEFNAEFFTTQKHGLTRVKTEVELYNTLIDDSYFSQNSYDGGGEQQEKHAIQVIIQQAPSFPFGSAFSAVTGLNLSFVTAELYQDDIYLSSETAVRIPMNPLDQEAIGLIEKIRAAFGIIDYQNISLRKQVTFNNMIPGRYTIKLYHENQFLRSARQYIGFTTVDLGNEDTMVRVQGGRQQSINFDLIDQDNEQVEGAQVTILTDGEVVSTGNTDAKGSLILTLPSTLHDLELEVSLQGVTCYRETITLSALQIQPLHKEVEIERYDLTIMLTDEWGLEPGVDITPIVFTSEQISLGYAKKTADSRYVFSSLAPDTYQVIVKYKSVIMDEAVELTKDTSLSLLFPALFQIRINVLDNHGLSCPGIDFSITRGGKTDQIQSESGKIDVNLPPGSYVTQIHKDDRLVVQRNLMVSGEETYDFVSSYQPLYPLLVSILLIAGFIALCIVFYQKQWINDIIPLIPIFFLAASLIAPWWAINGSMGSMETQTQLFFIPSSLITVTSSPDVMIGDQAYLPDLFLIMIQGIMGLIILTIFLTALWFYLYKFTEKKLFVLQFLIPFFTICILGVFIFGMSTLSEVSVGTFIGSGPLDISVGGQQQFQHVPCQWGPSIGFYLMCISLVLALLPIIQHIMHRIVNRFG